MVPIVRSKGAVHRQTSETRVPDDSKLPHIEGWSIRHRRPRKGQTTTRMYSENTDSRCMCPHRIGPGHSRIRRCRIRCPHTRREIAQRGVHRARCRRPTGGQIRETEKRHKVQYRSRTRGIIRSCRARNKPSQFSCRPRIRNSTSDNLPGQHELHGDNGAGRPNIGEITAHQYPVFLVVRKNKIRRSDTGA